MTTPRPVSLLERERLALGELDEATAADVRARLAAEGTDPFAHLPDNATVFAEDAPGDVVREVRRRAAEADWASRRPRRTVWQWLGTAVAIAVVLIAVGRGVLTPAPLPGDIVLKGGSELVLYRQTDRGPERLTSGAQAHQGDTVQLAFQAAGARHGLLLSIDGRGAVTEHHRFSGKRPVGEVVLDTAYVLDDAPRFEVFHLILADAPFDADALLTSVQRGGATTAPPVVPAHTRVLSLTLTKAAR